MRKMTRIIYVSLLAIVGLLAASISPLMVLLASISLTAFLMIATQINLYKIFMTMKRWAKTVSRLRFETRAKLHTGFRDYSDSLDTERSHHRSSGFAR